MSHPAAVAVGGSELSVIRYPVIPTLSLTLKLTIGTVSDVDVLGKANLITVGAVVSGKVMVTVADFPAETLPEASLVHAYAVRVPLALKVKLVGTVALHPAAVAEGAVARSEIR